MKSARSFLFVLLALGVSSAATPAQQQTHDHRLTDVEFNHVLDTLSGQLGRWEELFDAADPSKHPTLSYQVGKLVERNQQIGLGNISTARVAIKGLRVKRAVAAELNLRDVLADMNTAASDIVAWHGVSDSHANEIVTFSQELDKIRAALTNDIFARLESLDREKGCS